MRFRLVDNIWDELKRYTVDDNYILITDDNIYRLYKDDIDRLLCVRNNILLIKPGEESKNLENVVKIYDKLVEKNIDRNGFILSLGGGMIGDLAGFAASTYKRGINYVQIPTTLLAQVDSSIGGKTAVNYGGYKNLIGTFYFPVETIIDIRFLKTLSKRDFISGLGEVVKYGIIADYEFFKYIKENLNGIFDKEDNILRYIVGKSVEIKSSIVEKDKFDLNIRHNLNFGHTVGHSIESHFNYEMYYHGEAVILGMLVELKIAYLKGLIGNEYFEEIRALLLSLIESYKFNEDEIDGLIKIMKNDKKNIDRKIAFVLPVGKGKVDTFFDIEEKTIKDAFLTYYREWKYED